jgi:hypothetical protein
MITTLPHHVDKLTGLVDGVRTAITPALAGPTPLRSSPGSRAGGQITRIHDQVTWCALGVVRGVEHEELLDGGLNLVGRKENQVGDVSGFAPPGDIHRVRNTGDTTAISIHIYGTDITRMGSSARRYYD